jgi:hypothetical protein
MTDAADRDKVAAWVAKLNRLGREMDDACEGVHPSAWAELTAEKRAKWRKLVREGASEPAR